MNKKETKAYMHKYYLKHKEERHQEYLKWCVENPNRNRSERGKENRTPEERENYGREYYAAHKARYSETHRRWCAENPKQFADGQQVWRDRNRHYPRDYKRERVAVVDPLIFQFMDSGFDSNITDFVEYLRSKGTSEKHINWFRVDYQKQLFEGGTKWL